MNALEQTHWYAIHTRFKCEKLVARMLHKKQIEAWVPLSKFARQYGKKRRMVELPVISCYVFVKIQASEHIKVLETDHVAGFVKFEGKPAAIPDGEILILQQIIGEGIETNAVPSTFIEGEQVEIIQGALAGLQGKLLHHHNGNKFLVELERLGYTLQLTIDQDKMRPISQKLRL